MPKCLTCGKSFEDYSELAKHIMTTPKHRKGKKWAAKYIHLNTLSLRARNGALKGRTPLTDEQKEARQDSIRVPSGDTVRMDTFCPKCKIKYTDVFEVEYAYDKDAWRVKDCLVRLCFDCRPSR